MAKVAILKYGDKEFELPVVEGSEGELGIDIGQLRAKTGLITLDNGYMNTGACQSAVTFLDGEKGILRYRGIPIEDLAEHSNFVETSFLLIYGRLPTLKELVRFTNNLTRHTIIHEDMKRFYDGFPRDAHPMAILSSAVATLSTFYQDTSSVDSPEHLELSIFRLLAKIPTIAAFAYKKSIGQPFVYPTNSLDYCSNFMKMMFAVPAEEYQADPEISRALDLLLILHADHEQNCSTSTVRLVGSSRANLYASVSAGISALWGPLHGGANQEVVEMLQTIKGNGGNVRKFVERVKSKEEGVKLFGFGHRVYKNFDPRAKIIKRSCDAVLAKLGVSDPLLDIAKQLEEAALADEYFISRKLYPNVDFYSGIIYRALNIPMNMFTVMFAIGRAPGWVAQWKEMLESPNAKIGRPRQIYTGPKQRRYVPVGQR
ncbi:MAG: citrate synthase [Deltaproteobacteria bacterium]|nr:citrate synthase [Deltaproteobacteria bacterium]MBI3293650.1 citrate synthase [Deltaproteobacteria bacterium]